MGVIVYALPGNEVLAAQLVRTLGARAGELVLRQFPDGEWYLRVLTAAAGDDVVLACSLDRPNEKLVALYQLASSLRDDGAGRIVLAAPYLAYLRQDRRFLEGEALTSHSIARWLSGFIDGLVTVDPHLHRIHRLDEIYRVPSVVVPAAPAIARWVRRHVERPILIGPDAESEQWLSQVATLAQCPYRMLEKQRHGDREVEVSVPDLAGGVDRIPVLIDDIISTARTLVAALERLHEAGLPRAVCIGVHGLFVGDAEEALRQAGAARVLTCNTVNHASNAIDVHADIATAVASLLAARPGEPSPPPR